MSDFYTYMVRCSDDSLYTGYTTDLEHRVKAHNEGKAGAKYTRSRRPVVLVYYEKFASKHEAMSREIQIKKLSRQQKLKLVEKENGNLRQTKGKGSDVGRRAGAEEGRQGSGEAAG